MDKDKILYNEFLNGNKNALIELMQKYKNDLLYFIIRFVKNMEKAEDVYQNVVLFILENKEYYNINYSFKSYIFMIAKSKSLDYLKSEKYTEKLEEIENKIYDYKILDEIIFSKERSEKIKRNIEKMPKDYQLVIFLTQIEKFSYKEAAMIMEKKESQIKTLTFNARKKLKELLIREKIVEIKNNKVIKLLILIILMTTISTTVVYAGKLIYNKIKRQAVIQPIFTEKMGDTNINNIWIGTFQIAWNELENVLGKKIEFEDYKSELINELSKKVFSKEMISESDYYIEVGKTSQELKRKIKEDLKEKWNFEQSEILEKINFAENENNAYTIYAMLFKKFEFLEKFDKLDKRKFGNSNELVSYFGINNATDEKVNNNVKVLYYNNSSDFCIILETRESEEIILCMTEEMNSFDEIYNKIKIKSNEFYGDSEFKKNDELIIPFIELNSIINYNEICGKIIKDTDQIYITNAIQNVKFSLNEKGGNLISESGIRTEYNLIEDEVRRFYFNKPFVIFMREKGGEMPYFSLKVNNSEILVTED